MGIGGFFKGLFELSPEAQAALDEKTKRINEQASRIKNQIKEDVDDQLQKNAGDENERLEQLHKDNLHNIAAEINGEYHSKVKELETSDRYDTLLGEFNMLLDHKLEQARVFGEIPEDFSEFIKERRTQFHGYCKSKKLTASE